MTICYVFQDQYPWDIRVEKIITSLAHNGHECRVVSRNRSGLQTTEKLGDGVYVDRLPKGLGKISRTLINFPAFFSVFWIYAIISNIKKFNSKLIIVRDLPLSPAALLAGRLTGIPVIIDMAENYPAMIRSTWEYGKIGILDPIIRNPLFLSYLEKKIIPLLDGVIVVSEMSKERIEKLGNKNKKPVWLVGNTPRTELEVKKVTVKEYNKLREKHEYILIYTGGLEHGRGLDTVIKAVPKIIEAVPSFLFIIAGLGASQDELSELAEELNVKSNVLFTGWVEPDKIPSLIKCSDVCVVPHYVDEHVNSTVPNKIFDYMLQKKPVIVTHAETLIDIVETTGCGFVYHDKNHDELADKIINLRDKKLRVKIGENGYNGVIKKYNWNVDEKILFSCIESFDVKIQT